VTPISRSRAGCRCHVRGKAYRYELEVPGSAPRTLLDVPRYDFNWQLLYRLSEHIDLPAGSVLKGTARYDNSAGNPANPDPTRRVQWGEQTDEEMMLGYIEYYLPEVPPGTPSDLRASAARGGGSKTFDSLDRNHDGRITPDESPSPAQFKAADKDGNGEVSREELKGFLQQQKRRRSSDSKPPADGR
jgi:EF hand